MMSIDNAVKRGTRLASCTLALWLGASSVAHAVDGVVEINQAKILASGGFPYTIAQPGSYRLTSNVDVSAQPTPYNVTAIKITGSNVTLDLNGFAILGPVICYTLTDGGSLTCSTTGSGKGIDASGYAIAVRNGAVKGMGHTGIFVSGPDAVVENITATENGVNGVSIATGRLSHIVAGRNNGTGVEATSAAIADVFASLNKLNGVRVDGDGLVSRAVATRNGSYGLYLAADTGYSNCTATHNFAAFPNAQVSSGRNLGGNYCTGSLPGCT